MNTETKKSRRTITVLNAGANRGARAGLDAFERWNRESVSVSLIPRYIDPAPGRSITLKVEAEARGLNAEAFEGTIEDSLSEKNIDGQPILLNLDSPKAIAETILSSENIGSPILGYLLLKLPGGELWGVRFFLLPNDLEARRLGVKFFSRLGELTARRGSAAIFGAEGSLAHRAVEGKYRNWFANHTRTNLGKLLAGLEPDGDIFEVTDDGETTLTLLVQESEAWSDPQELAEKIAADPPVPILRGGSFVIGELTADGVRFHKVRRRVTDDRIALRGRSAMDTESVEAERLARETAEALAKAERQTVSKRNPLLATD